VSTARRLRAAAALTAVGLLTLAIVGAGPTAQASPDAPDPAAVPAPAEMTAEEPVVRVPDRTDRRWPRNPPWDACPRPVWEGEHASGEPGAGRRVLVIGDSLTRDSRVLSARGMRASGWTPTFRCWGSRRLDWGLAQVARSRALRQLPEYVVVALGTNDISWETPTTTERRVRALLARLGPQRKVLWVDLHLTRSAWLDARADWFNGLLGRLEATHPNLTVVHWHAVARAHRIHGWDGIHYGPYGFRLRARTLVAALNRAGRADPVVAAVPVPSSAPSPLPEPTPAPSPASGPTAIATASPSPATLAPDPSAAPSGALRGA
jgi:hypothetical protein